MIDELQRAIESMHSASAKFVQAVPVREALDGKLVWEGVLHIFDLAAHPTATRALVLADRGDRQAAILWRVESAASR